LAIVKLSVGVQSGMLARVISSALYSIGSGCARSWMYALTPSE
jgi:hypothetical protein